MLAGSISSYVTTASDASFDTINANMKSAFTNRYNAGVTYADGRTNTSSTNYKNGYNAGYSAGGGGIKYKSGVYNTGLNGEAWRTTSFNTGLSSITALQVRSYVGSEYGVSDERDNRISSVLISGGKVTVTFYAGDYVNNYIKWLAVGK